MLSPEVGKYCDFYFHILDQGGIMSSMGPAAEWNTSVKSEVAIRGSLGGIEFPFFILCMAGVGFDRDIDRRWKSMGALTLGQPPQTFARIRTDFQRFYTITASIYPCLRLESVRKSPPRTPNRNYRNPPLSTPQFIECSRDLFRDTPLTRLSITHRQTS